MAHEFERQLFDLIRDFKRVDAEAARPVPPPREVPPPLPQVPTPASPEPLHAAASAAEQVVAGAGGTTTRDDELSADDAAPGAGAGIAGAATDIVASLWGFIWRATTVVAAAGVTLWAVVAILSSTGSAADPRAGSQDSVGGVVTSPDSAPPDPPVPQYSWPFEMSDVGAPAVPQCQRDLRLQRGTVMVEGLFVENECLGADFGRYRAVLISGLRGDSLIATVRSTEFDPYVTLAALDGTVIDGDDDSDGGLNARLVAVLPDSSDYWLVVSQYAGISRPPASGRFELAIRWQADSSAVLPAESGTTATLDAPGSTNDGRQAVPPVPPRSTDGMPQVISMPTRRVIEEALAVFDVMMVNKDWAPILRGQPRQLDAVRELLADPVALLCSDCGVQSQAVGSPAVDAQRRQVVPGVLVIRTKSGGGTRSRRVPVRFVGQSTVGGGWVLTEVELTGMPF